MCSGEILLATGCKSLIPHTCTVRSEAGLPSPAMQCLNGVLTASQHGCKQQARLKIWFTTQFFFVTCLLVGGRLLSLLYAAGYGTESQDGPCQLCPSGYFGQGFKREPCQPCPFGYTSAPGSTTGKCVPMIQSCPVGQIADPQDQPVSADDCHCFPGFGGKCVAALHLDSPSPVTHLCNGLCVVLLQLQGKLV